MRTCERLCLAAMLVVFFDWRDPTGANCQARETVSLARAVAEALERNARLQGEHDNVEQANLNLRLARNVFQLKVIPNIQGSFGQTDVTNQGYRLDVSQRLATGSELRAGVGASTAQIPSTSGGDIRFYNTDTTLALSQPLLRGFGRSVTRRGEVRSEERRVGKECRL